MKRAYAQWLVLSAFLVLCFAAAALGSQFTSQSINSWYNTLEKPAWNPPNWVFAPVWTFLYLAMALAAWLVWRERGFQGAAGALGLFVLQLALNVAWSGLFFGLRNPLAGFVDIVLLWLAILGTLIAFWRINTAAGLLFVPYWLWVTYAGALNFVLWRMNA